MSNEEWAFFEPFGTRRGPHGGRRPQDHRRVLDGVFWIAQTGALPLLDADGPEPKIHLADRGYDADEIRSAMQARDVTPIIPMRRSRKIQWPVDAPIYPPRNRIERCFEKLKNRRRLATRYDKTADGDLGFVLITAARLSTRVFVNRT